MSALEIRHGNCLDVLAVAARAGERYHAVVTDPPYHLTSIQKRFGKEGSAPAQHGRDGSFARLSKGFMGKTWDGGDVAFRPETWRLVYDVLYPGAHMAVFGGTRTFHRMAVAIEDAGFEIRDEILWLYGCLDDVTCVATPDGVKAHTDLKPGDIVICYETNTNTYSLQPVLDIVEYDYADTAYRISGDFGEQVVSRNHRCIVERGGVETFQFAENAAQEHETRVPFLEDLRTLQGALRDSESHPGGAEPAVRQNVPVGGACRRKTWAQEKSGGLPGSDDTLFGMRDGGLAVQLPFAADGVGEVQLSMQWGGPGPRMGDARAQRPSGVDPAEYSSTGRAVDRAGEPSLGRRDNLPEPERSLRRSGHKIRTVSAGVPDDGAEGRICDGASSGSGAMSGPAVAADRVCASPGPRRDSVSAGQPDVVCDERPAQSVREWPGHKTTVVRVVPFHYTGKVWCLRVPTGAFVAVRKGVAFPTGNSGFPKSHAVDKGIDKTLDKPGAVDPKGNPVARMIPGADQAKDGWAKTNGREYQPGDYVPATPEGAAWAGYGTALKPAHEPILLVRKPLEGTVARNVLAHGVGGLNIDGCRTPMEEGRAEYINERLKGFRNTRSIGGTTAYGGGQIGIAEGYDPTKGRWPPNILHDGSPEVLEAFGRFGERPTSKPGSVVKKASSADQSGNQGAAYGAESRAAGSVMTAYGDSGSAARFFPALGYTEEDYRFFYSSKANKAERMGSQHPTVKPIALLRWLARLITPPGGRILDPFAGTGTTGAAARAEGFGFTGVEMTDEYVEDCIRRLPEAAVDRGPWGLDLRDTLARNRAAHNKLTEALRHAERL